MRTPQHVIEDALAEPPDSHERWAHVYRLHARDDEETFGAAAELLDSADPERRSLGTEVLAQLGSAKDVPVERRPFARPACGLLIARIGEETDPHVLRSMATAFCHLKDPRCVPALYALREHPDEDVRLGVAYGLEALDDDLAVETLVELSRDQNPRVRDWATFGLGTQIDRDDAQVRDALLARLDDPDEDTRAEALRGLGARGDERAISPLLVELEGPKGFQDPDDIVDEALLAFAVRSADKRLCRYVEARRRSWEADRPDGPLPDDLRAAVQACALHAAGRARVA
jgi:HEAT repeat protein